MKCAVIFLQKKYKFAFDLILYTVVSAVLNIVGTTFRVWVSNKVGAETMGLHSLVYSVYLPACTLAVSSVNLASTRLVTEALAKNTGGIGKIMRKCFIYSLIFGSFSCALLWIFAKPIGLYWIKNESAVLPLKIICFGLPWLSVSSGIHGAFTAMRKISRSVIVQITEDLTKIAVTYLLLTVFFNENINSWGVVALVCGSAVGETLSCVVALILWLIEKKSPSKDIKVTKKLLKIALPSAISQYARSGLSMFESLMIPVGFRKYGMTESQTLATLGTLKGMVLPVIFFPATLINSFSRLIVPETAEAFEKNDRKMIESVSVRSVKTTLTFAFFVMFVFLFFADGISVLLYQSTETASLLRLLSPFIPLMYLDGVVDSLIKGLDGQLFSMRINIIDSLCRVVAVIFLIPITGFEGYIFIMLFSTVLNGSLSLRRFSVISEVKIPLVPCVFQPLFYSASAVFVPFALFRMTDDGNIIVFIIFSAVLYTYFMFGNKIMKFVKMLLTKRTVNDKIFKDV